MDAGPGCACRPCGGTVLRSASGLGPRAALQKLVFSRFRLIRRRDHEPCLGPRAGRRRFVPCSFSPSSPGKPGFFSEL